MEPFGYKDTSPIFFNNLVFSSTAGRLPADTTATSTSVTHQQVGLRHVGVRVRLRLERAHHVDHAPRLQVARLGRGGLRLQRALRRRSRTAGPRAVRRQRVDAVPAGHSLLIPPRDYHGNTDRHKNSPWNFNILLRNPRQQPSDNFLPDTPSWSEDPPF